MTGIYPPAVQRRQTKNNRHLLPFTRHQETPKLCRESRQYSKLTEDLDDFESPVHHVLYARRQQRSHCYPLTGERQGKCLDRRALTANTMGTKYKLSLFEYVVAVVLKDRNLFCWDTTPLAGLLLYGFPSPDLMAEEEESNQTMSTAHDIPILRHSHHDILVTRYTRDTIYS